MREAIVNYLNNEIFNNDNEKEKVEKAIEYFKYLSEYDKGSFLQILVNIKERNMEISDFTFLFFSQLEIEKVNYNYSNILQYISDAESILRHEDIVLILARNESLLKSFIENPSNHINAYHLLLTLYLNDYNIDFFNPPEKFEFSVQYLNNIHLQERLNQNLLNNKDLNGFINAYFNLPSHSNMQRIQFIIRNEKLNKVLIKHKKIRDFIIEQIEHSDFKMIKYFESSFDFLKEIEKNNVNNPKKHVLFLNEIMKMCNTNQSVCEKYLNEFIINNKKGINNDYNIKGEYTLLYPSYYYNEENYNLLKNHLDIIKEEPLVFSNLIHSIIHEKETKEAVKLIKNYFKDPKYIKNESRSLEFGENGSMEISSVISSLTSKQTTPLNKIIKNIPIIKTLLKSGEKPDVDDSFILDLKHRMSSVEKKDIKKVIELINLFIEYSDINNIYAEKILLKTRSRYIFEDIKNQFTKEQSIDFDKLLYSEKMIENKPQFFMFCLDMEKEAIQKYNFIYLNKYLHDKRKYIMDNSQQQELKDILQALNLRNGEKEFNEIISQIENKIIKMSVNEVISINPVSKRRL